MTDEPASPFGGPVDLSKLMGQAQQLMADVGKKREAYEKALEKEIVEAAAGGGMVRVKANGLGRILSISFDRELVQPLDTDLLQDVTTAAVNEALRRAEAAADRVKNEMLAALPFAGLFQGKL